MSNIKPKIKSKIQPKSVIAVVAPRTIAVAVTITAAVIPITIVAGVIVATIPGVIVAVATVPGEIVARSHTGSAGNAVGVVPTGVPAIPVVRIPSGTAVVVVVVCALVRTGFGVDVLAAWGVPPIIERHIPPIV